MEHRIAHNHGMSGDDRMVMEALVILLKERFGGAD